MSIVPLFRIKGIKRMRWFKPSFEMLMRGKFVVAVLHTPQQIWNWTLVFIFFFFLSSTSSFLVLLSSLTLFLSSSYNLTIRSHLVWTLSKYIFRYLDSFIALVDCFFICWLAVSCSFFLSFFFFSCFTFHHHEHPLSSYPFRFPSRIHVCETKINQTKKTKHTQKKKRKISTHFFLLISYRAIWSLHIMSRTDFHDFDYPPGLGAQRARSTEREQLLNFSSGVINIGPDRRTSNGNGQPAYSPGYTRLNGQESHRDYTYGLPELSGPNRHTSSSSLAHFSTQSPFPTFNHNHHRPSPPPQNSATSSPAALFPSSPIERFPFDPRQSHQSNAFQTSSISTTTHNTQSSTANSLAARSTLWWGELEPWMDEEYAKQVCNLMGWDPVNIKVPHPAPDPTSGQQSNNPGYCFLTFPTPAHAASVLNQVKHQQGNTGQSPAKAAPITMPNSTKPFVMNWASSMLAASPLATAFPAATTGTQPAPAQQYPKEYSIFVGDLAPETSNSDLVAVFRNPVLGLRNDREPKFIRPFLSCKSAKIMLDPVTGVSRGYGFVRYVQTLSK